MENLFIVGNGFDLAHGLKTSYGDFKKFLHTHYDMKNVSFDGVEELYDFEFPESILDGDGSSAIDFEKYSKIYFKICNHLNEDEDTWQTDWSNFENNLAKITSIEVDGTNLEDKEGDFDGSQTAQLCAQLSEDFNLAYHGMTEHFFEQWIRSVHQSDNYKGLVNGCCKNLKELVLARRLDSYFLTFNYTPVLEDVYGIADEQVCHIHGRIEEFNLVIGHGDDTAYETEDYNPLDFDFSKAKENSRKHVEEIIEANQEFFQKLANVKNIYIIGSSIVDGNLIDRPYLEEVFCHVSDEVTVYLDSYGMTQSKKQKQERLLTELSDKVRSVEVIDSHHHAVLTKLDQ